MRPLETNRQTMYAAKHLLVYYWVDIGFYIPIIVQLVPKKCLNSMNLHLKYCLFGIKICILFHNNVVRKWQKWSVLRNSFWFWRRLAYIFRTRTERMIYEMCKWKAIHHMDSPMSIEKMQNSWMGIFQCFVSRFILDMIDFILILIQMKSFLWIFRYWRHFMESFPCRNSFKIVQWTY